jgi:hypothetical protein
MKSWMLALLIPLAILGSSARAEDLRAEMEASNKQWLEAFNTPSIASFPAMYTEDAILPRRNGSGDTGTGCDYEVLGR